MIKNVLSEIAVFLLCMLVCFSCNQEEGPYGGTAVISAQAETQNINPLLVRNSPATFLSEFFFNALVRFNQEMDLTPEIATSWSVSDDGMTWRFAIRKGILFHDGEELTAEDVLFTYNSVLDPELESPLASRFGVVDRFEASGKYEFVIVLREPYAPIISLLMLEILPKHLLDAGEDQWDEYGLAPVGTGPFVLSSRGSSELTLSAFDDYFEGRPYLDSIIVRTLPDRRMAWSELMQGNVDIMRDLDLDDYRIIADDARFQDYSYLDVFYYTMLLNLNDPLLADAEVRRAIDLCIDRGDIIHDTLEDWAVATSGPFRPGTWPYNEEIIAAAYDPDQARTILAGLGWRDTDGDSILDKNGDELSISLLVDSGDDLKVAVAQRIKWQLFKSGIKVEVEFLGLQDLFQQRLFPGNFQSVLLQFNAGGDPDTPTHSFWHSSQIGRSNLTSYRNDEVDRLIDLGKVTIDIDERRQIYHKIHEMIAGDRPALFLFVRKIYIAATAKLKGIDPNPEMFYSSAKNWRIDES